MRRATVSTEQRDRDGKKMEKLFLASRNLSLFYVGYFNFSISQNFRYCWKRKDDLPWENINPSTHATNGRLLLQPTSSSTASKHHQHLSSFAAAAAAQQIAFHLPRNLFAALAKK